MAVNLASKYSKFVDDAFWTDSILGGATNNKVDFTGVNEVTVYSVDAMDMNDYTRSGTNRYGTPEELDDHTQTFAITKDRSFTGTIDKGNAQDQLNVKDAGARLHVQMQSIVTPEIDQYVLNLWSYGAGKVVGVSAPTKSTIVGLVANSVTYMNNSLVPKLGRILFLTETCYSYLAQATEFSTLDKIGAKALSDYDVGRVLGVTVRSVPDSYMPANVYFILQHKAACPFIKKLDEYKIHRDPPGINGNLIEGACAMGPGSWVKKATHLRLCQHFLRAGGADRDRVFRYRDRHRFWRDPVLHPRTNRPALQRYPYSDYLRRHFFHRRNDHRQGLWLHRDEVPVHRYH
jgi:hypothetical protein